MFQILNKMYAGRIAKNNIRLAVQSDQTGFGTAMVYITVHVLTVKVLYHQRPVHTKDQFKLDL